MLSFFVIILHSFSLMNTDWNWDCESYSEVCYSAPLLLLKSNLTCPPLSVLHLNVLWCVISTRTANSRAYPGNIWKRGLTGWLFVKSSSSSSVVPLQHCWLHTVHCRHLDCCFYFSGKITCVLWTLKQRRLFFSPLWRSALLLFHVSLSALTNTELDETRSPRVLVPPLYDTGNLLLISVGLQECTCFIFVEISEFISFTAGYWYWILKSNNHWRV